MKAYEFQLAPWSQFLRLLLAGWVPAVYDDTRYCGWRCPLEREAR